MVKYKNRNDTNKKEVINLKIKKIQRNLIQKQLKFIMIMIMNIMKL